jgi:uncharacterized repeat protein (TIGR01451 family)
VRLGEQIDTAIALTAGGTPIQGVLTASVVAHESDPVPGDNSVTTAVATARIADLGVALVANSTAVDHHAPVTLTATATNAGPNASTATEVVIDLGSGLSFQSATPSQGGCTQAGITLTCALGVIDPAAQATVAVSTAANSVGALTPSAQISDVGLQDPVAGNNLATATMTSKSVADLGVQIVEASDPVTSGQSLRYTATVTNNGPDDLANATVTINVAGAAVASASTAQGTCTPAGSTVNCTIGAIPSGSNATVNIDTTAGPAGAASATANVGFSGTDTSATNDSAMQTTTVNAVQSGGGGGGGAAGPLELLVLVALLVARSRATGFGGTDRRSRPRTET